MWQLQYCFIIDYPMNHFKYPTEEVLSLFINKLYQESRFRSLIQEEQIQQLERLIRKKLRQPHKLFKILVNRPANITERDSRLKEEVSPISRVNLMDIIELQQQVKHIKPNQNQSLSFCFNNWALLQHNQTIITSPKISTNQPLSQQQSSSEHDDDSQDEFDEEMRLVDDTKTMAHEHCKFHFSGLYNHTCKSMNNKKTMRKLNMPFFIVKQPNSPQEIIIRNCHSDLTFGSIVVAHNLLFKHQMSQNE